MAENPLMRAATNTSPRPGTQPANTGATTVLAKAAGANVALAAAESAGHVGATVKDGASEVASKIGSQGRDLLAQLGTELTDRADGQQQRLAAGFRSAAEELQSMADSSDHRGMASDLVRQGADRSASVASWLEARDSTASLAEVRGFARHRPAAFLALAAGIGILAGRLTKGLSGGTSSSGTRNGRVSAPVKPVSATLEPMPVQPYGTRDVYTEPTVAPGEPPASTTTLPGS
ncbi:hypothetical protein IV498_05865 [Paenarthrobacter sp. Z7-10]|uniref:hypothetical protein n=1 Tax=Paenarthrobacter sp. Z7-10 TaxID=2787635 RepID=UPI0022A975A1|nr:hypothetical protein [Paenarthrobacter sp. Z7-10]MCZ2402722.1 hypothetical protein [Paenarthrobacter sp. Z7-10]